MADIVRRVEYYYALVPDRAGAGAKVFNALKEASVNLIAVNGFPRCMRRAQLVFVPSDRDAFVTAAKKTGVKLVGPKVAFLIQGENRIGAIAEVLGKLGKAQISITALQAVASGEDRYGAILWVKSSSVGKAAQALGVS